MNAWSVRSVNHLHDVWAITYRTQRVGSVHWVRSLRHPELTKARITAGLNGVHGDAQPPRTWSFGTEGSQGRWDIRHNGVTVGELAWDIAPPVEPDVWQDRILAGLNWVSDVRSMTAPEPAQPDLRRVS